MTRRLLLLTIAAAALAADGEKPPSLAAKLTPAPRFSLGPFQQQPRPAGIDQRDPLQIGSHRPLPADAVKKGKWTKLRDGGKVWRLQLQSPGAKALRFHFQKFAVGKGKVWLYEGPPGDIKVSGPYTGTGIDEKGEFWSATISGDTAVVEFLPEGKAPKNLPFQLAEISHQFR